MGYLKFSHQPYKKRSLYISINTFRSTYPYFGSRCCSPLILSLLWRAVGPPKFGLDCRRPDVLNPTAAVTAAASMHCFYSPSHKNWSHQFQSRPLILLQNCNLPFYFFLILEYSISILFGSKRKKNKPELYVQSKWG